MMFESAQPPRVVVIGTGSLARSVCDTLATRARVPVDVVVIGRDPARVAELCVVGGARAALAGGSTAFQGHSTDLSDADQLAAVLADTRPDGVLLCASMQSPWERVTAPSAWTALLRRGGFGVTLPLQARLALVTGRAVAQAVPSAWLLNASFPDAVNPVLAALSVPVLAGVGNVATLAAGAQARLGLPGQDRLALIAHHVHLHTPDDPAGEALAWYDGAPVADVGSLLAPVRAVDRQRLNAVTGATAAHLLLALLTGSRLATHLPGPHGLPGGYPVLADGSRITLRLPSGVTRAEAIAANERAAAGDGVTVAGGRVTFTEPARAALAGVDAGLAAGFPVGDVEPAAEALLRVRERLRARPSGVDAVPPDPIP